MIYYILLGRILQLPRGKAHKRTSRSYSKVPHLTHLPIRIRKDSHSTGITLHFSNSAWILLRPTELSTFKDLSSLSEKTRKSNHVQMKLQRQHFLLSYLKTLSVGPVGVSNSRPPASHRCTTKWATGARINFSLKSKLRWYVVVEQMTSWTTSSLNIIPFVKEILPSFEATAKKVICCYFICSCTTPPQLILHWKKIFRRLINCFMLFLLHKLTFNDLSFHSIQFLSKFRKKFLLKK